MTQAPAEWDISWKITIFEARVRDWTLAVADSEALKQDGRSGHAGLNIILCYFEMIGQYLEGCTSDIIETVKNIDPLKDTSEHNSP